ncbi:BRCT domain-containing protein [Lentilactobacillus hilgardii]|uniref:BRCT domain-containing protein n=1 Tax=Lentilactobacillus hilgardii TaxID=1588 RepID=UPI0021C31B15|nr:BRCT domain-containing protein [Lentilactobacillus hilgardii]MCP9333213.1 BRCT domain-containing protein [Lentilactobacillus hilgardii]MCP9349854.1 BRCT domain-containing protein [Lentilactobacillus hilgardii]MCP9352750.1 BRCT domain-containing protein [Lentilactobacillus hilgardii]
MIDLTNMEIVFTGKLASMPRKQAFAVASAFGAVPKSQITKQTDYLVVGAIHKTIGEPLTTHKLNIPNIKHITEKDFINWCQWKLSIWKDNLK